MALINVRAPQPITEKVVGIAFVDGKAEVESGTARGRRALAYFGRHGYAIEAQADAVPAESGEPAQAPAGPPNRSASKADWVAYATSEAAGDKRLTAEQADALNRDQLVEHVLGPKEA